MSKNKEDYRTIVKALKLKVIKLQEQIDTLQKNTQAPPSLPASVEELLQLLKALQNKLNLVGLTVFDYFRQYDLDYSKAIQKSSQYLPQFSLLLELISKNSSVPFSDLESAFARMGLTDSHNDQAGLSIATQLGQIQFSELWQRINQGGRLTSSKKLVQLLKDKFDLFEICGLFTRLKQEEQAPDSDLVQFRLRCILNQHSATFPKLQKMQLDDTPAVKPHSECRVMSSSNQFMSMVITDIRSQIRHSLKRRTGLDENREILMSLKRKSLTLSKIFNSLLQNLDWETYQNVITFSFFQKCMRLGGFRGMDVTSQIRLFFAIDKDEKGHISFEQIFAFLIQNHQSQDKLQVALKLLFASNRQHRGRDLLDVLEILQETEETQLGVDKVVGIFGLKRNIWTSRDVLQLIMWLLLQQRAKSKNKSIPKSLEASRDFLIKRVRNLVELEKQDEKVEEILELQSQSRMERLTIAVGMI